MIVYLAGEAYGEDVFKYFKYKFSRLDSFFYSKNSKWQTENIKKYNRFILDSGAFTFIMQDKKNKGVSIDIDSFTDEYIDYINHHSVDLFFEMDVDSVFGYDKVKQLRKRIEKKTGKRSIPVFHMSRGIEDFKATCNDYDYISLGIGGKDFSFTDVSAFKAFNDYAKLKNTKVHMLGVTGMTVLDKVDFYSVDSSAWTSGNRYKGIFRFINGKCIMVNKNQISNKSIKNHKSLAIHNFQEWMKFSNYAEKML